MLQQSNEIFIMKDKKENQLLGWAQTKVCQFDC